MLDYNWGEQSSVLLLSDEQNQENDQNRHFFEPYAPNTQTFTENPYPHQHFPTIQQQNQHFFHTQNNPTTLYDPRGYETCYPQGPILQPTISGLMAVPKSESHQFVGSGGIDFASSSRIGLNLGGRTYFSSSEDDFVNRLYRRTRAVEAGSVMNPPRCQAEGCNADLTHAKHYHRRHKVCEFHSKASTVIAAGLTQRFCQQCSRFHLLSEFDNGKRSCRKRLADHNRRRRKNQQSNLENSSKSQLDSTRNSPSDSLARSPADSGAHCSSVTVAISPPRISLDCFRQRP